MLHINKNSKYLGYSQITVSDELSANSPMTYQINGPNVAGPQE